KFVKLYVEICNIFTCPNQLQKYGKNLKKVLEIPSDSQIVLVASMASMLLSSVQTKQDLIIGLILAVLVKTATVEYSKLPTWEEDLKQIRWVYLSRKISQARMNFPPCLNWRRSLCTKTILVEALSIQSKQNRYFSRKII
ncbi:hypothetical protein PPYR_01461, partial [Photinus pyralis]